ncbi:hypothetical protein PG994_008896 [Apiospora phragmitis]|uniref:Xylanolytic transcriptional activator regulatory domain-containing protein n=1 Tax=Apiospora phragmitis TaxID=2905665 RepID=A0ABR1UHS5_9PEZI
MTDPEAPEIVEVSVRRARRRAPKTRKDESSEAPQQSPQPAGNPESQAEVGLILEAMKVGRERFHAAGYQPPNAGDQAKNNKSSDVFPRPHIRIGTLETDKTRLFGRAHWFNLMEKLQFLGPTALNGLQEGMASLTKEVASRRSSLKLHRTLELHDPLPDLTRTLPPKATCDQLLSNYWRFFEPIFRVLHRTAFEREYDSYWAGSTRPSTGFVLKLTMALGLGAIFHRDLAESGRIRGLAKSWLYAVQWWLMGPLEKTARCLDGVQTFCLAVLLRQASSLGGASSISTDALMKLAMSLGLHLDPDGFLVYGPFERELRRRIWHTVLELTVMASLDTTLPLLITADDYNCGPPSNLNDAEFGPDSEDLPQARPAVEFTDSATQLLLQKSLARRLYVVRKMNGVQKPLSYEETIELGKELKMQCRDIASFFHSRLPSTEGCDRDACEFHRKFLDSYLRRYILFLHRPFALQAGKDPWYHLARKTCLECCQIVSSHAAGLNLPQEVTDEFCLMAIRGSGLFKGPLSQDVIVHLGLELRQIVALGQPSCKRYFLLSAAMVHIEELEAGSSNPLPAAMARLTQCLKDCSEMLRLASAEVSQPATDLEPAWTEETSPDWTDTLGLFGFDFDLLDYNMESVHSVATEPHASRAMAEVLSES